MPVKIRLMRVGAKKRPFYRVVAVDERKKRTGGYLELLGTYNPLTNPKEILLKQDLIDAWIKKGAVMSDGYLRIIGKAPQKPPRKPKKEKAAAPAPASPAAPAEAPAAETATEDVAEAPTEMAAEETPTPEPSSDTPQAEESQTEEAAESAQEPIDTPPTETTEPEAGE